MTYRRNHAWQCGGVRGVRALHERHRTPPRGMYPAVAAKQAKQDEGLGILRSIFRVVGTATFGRGLGKERERERERWIMTRQRLCRCGDTWHLELSAEAAAADVVKG